LWNNTIKIGIVDNAGRVGLFHLNIRNNRFNPEEIKKLLYRNIFDYVLTRAKIDYF